MLTKEDAIQTVKSFTDEILKLGIPLDKVILFGSYAKNNQRENSDIDIALISPIFTGFGFEDRKHFSRINNQKPFIEIETKTFPTDYYYHSNDPFITEINQTGIELYNADQQPKTYPVFKNLLGLFLKILLIL